MAQQSIALVGLLDDVCKVGTKIPRYQSWYAVHECVPPLHAFPPGIDLIVYVTSEASLDSTLLNEVCLAGREQETQHRVMLLDGPVSGRFHCLVDVATISLSELLSIVGD